MIKWWLAAGIAVLAAAAVAQDETIDRGSGRGCIHSELPPHTHVARTDVGHVRMALFADATTRYQHGVLGDAIEALVLVVQFEATDGRELCDQLYVGDGRVFEDVGPRLVDVTGDGVAEIMVVASDQTLGARVEIYGYAGRGADLALLAATPYVGQRNRWYAPVGAADLDGDGFVEVAFVDRPHLAKVLRVFRYRDGALEPVTEAGGVTNHRIGERDIAGGIRDCGSGLEIIVASADWARLLAVRLVDGALLAEDIGRHAGRESFAAALECR